MLGLFQHPITQVRFASGLPKQVRHDLNEIELTKTIHIINPLKEGIRREKL